MNQPFVTEPERKTPVVHEVDVAVVGGGTAGTVAAIAAARNGASTVLIERLGSLGGAPTVGRCTHLSNVYLDAELRPTITGLPLEILERLVQAGGTTHSTLEGVLVGETRAPKFILVDPEILAILLIEMVEQAGVDLLLNTMFCDPVIAHDASSGDAVTGVLVQNKAGRLAVLAKNVVDCSGEADVAYRSGAPCLTNSGQPWFGNTFGLLLRVGHVDVERFFSYFMSLDAGTPDPDFTAWLAQHLGLSPEELQADRYWKQFVDPQPWSGGPREMAELRRFGPEVQQWYQKRWQDDGWFAYIHMHAFRDLMRQAVENGDFALKRPVDGIGEVGFNFDGFSAGRFRPGEVILNAIQPMNGLNMFDPAHATLVETSARKRALELLRFFQKYVPGFETCYIVDTGVETMARHTRMIEGVYTLTQEDVQASRPFEDSVYVTAAGWTPGVAQQVPYRMLLPQRVEHLLVAGKCAAGAHLARRIPDCMAMGQAAGTAAALAAQQGVTPRALDIRELQAALRGQGVKLHIV